MKKIPGNTYKQLNKNGEIKLKEVIKPVIKNKEKVPEIEFVLRTQTYKYKEKSYSADFENIFNRNEYVTLVENSGVLLLTCLLT